MLLESLRPCSPTKLQNLKIIIMFFNDGGLTLGHFDIFDTLFPFLAFAIAHNIMLSISRDGLTAKVLLCFYYNVYLQLTLLLGRMTLTSKLYMLTTRAVMQIFA